MFTERKFRVVLAKEALSGLRDIRGRVRRTNKDTRSFALSVTGLRRVDDLVARVRDRRLFNLVGGTKIKRFKPFRHLKRRRVRRVLRAGILNAVCVARTILPCFGRGGNNLLVGVVSATNLGKGMGRSICTTDGFTMEKFARDLRGRLRSANVGIGTICVNKVSAPF